MDGVRRRPAGEPELSALCEVIVAWLEQTGTTPTILVSGPPKGERHDVEAHALKLELEGAITEAFLDRLAAAGADRHAAPTVLRAAVEAGAGVAALRGLMIAYPAAASDGAACTDTGTGTGTGIGIRAAVAGESTPTATEIAARVREAFAVLGV